MTSGSFRLHTFPNTISFHWNRLLQPEGVGFMGSFNLTEGVAHIISFSPSLQSLCQKNWKFTRKSTIDTKQSVKHKACKVCFVRLSWQWDQCSCVLPTLTVMLTSWICPLSHITLSHSLWICDAALRLHINYLNYPQSRVVVQGIQRIPTRLPFQ